MTVIIARSLSDQYSQLKRTAAQLRLQCVVWRDRTLAGPTQLTEINDNLLSIIRTSTVNFTGLPAGLTQWARDEEDNQLYDAGAEFFTLHTAAVAALDWLVINIPQNGSNTVLERKIALDGTITPNTVTTAATAGLRTALQSIIDLIDAP